jgi:hypothetical protein
MTGERDSDTPEAIRGWLAEFDAIPPWEMTAAEEAEWQSARQAAKEYALQKTAQRLPDGQP